MRSNLTKGKMSSMLIRRGANKIYQQISHNKACIYKINRRCVSTTKVPWQLPVEKRENVEKDLTVDGLLKTSSTYLSRHIGPSSSDQSTMLRVVEASNMEELISSAVPVDIRMTSATSLGSGLDESQMYAHVKELADKNQVWRSYIGMGYHNCHVPPVIQRNVLENPGWITQYTPYQAELAQGRLYCLMMFQTMISDLTGLELANASLLDEGTAAAEGMGMCLRLNKKKKFLIDSRCHPQTISVVETRARGLGVEVEVVNRDVVDFSSGEISGILVQYPDTNGGVYNMTQIVENAHSHKALVVCATDLLSLTMLVPPGEFGCDIAVGSAQRMGIPLGYGGPHAGFISTHKKYARSLPGRVVGLAKDAQAIPPTD
ncbi:GLDC [Bugula neritina]|uniref:glycine dehydrogenase (aminomethyl-transferring) n=1 Tax=Bugula neritina TaxID=10212 RepID=A0A7J7JC09_BUGNE|nr:GLDC [Bugula neritina]